MIHITWGNLIPPRCSQANIVNSLLAPSFFNNPDLGKTIQESSFYQRKDGTILDALNSVLDKMTEDDYLTSVTLPRHLRSSSICCC